MSEGSAECRVTEFGSNNSLDTFTGNLLLGQQKLAPFHEPGTKKTHSSDGDKATKNVYTFTGNLLLIALSINQVRRINIQTATRPCSLASCC